MSVAQPAISKPYIGFGAVYTTFLLSIGDMRAAPFLLQSRRALKTGNAVSWSTLMGEWIIKSYRHHVQLSPIDER